MRDSCGGIYTRQGWLILLLFCLVMGSSAQAARISDVRGTKHNLSSLSVNSARADPDSVDTTTEVCVFCHTPHGANTHVSPSPLWNREPSSVTNYQLYSSTSLDYRDRFYEATGGQTYQEAFQPDGNSKLCLSCHDGTIALGSVTNRPGSGGYDLADPIDMVGVNANGTIYESPFGAESGFTRRIGIDLTNDHPISFTFNQDLAQRDGELHDPTAANSIVVGKAQKGELPLQQAGAETKMQCTTCHDPHVRAGSKSDGNPITWNIKFLRQNRFQGPASITDADFDATMYDVPAADFANDAPKQGEFDADRDILCLACHDKAGWATSVHATPYAGDEVYKDLAADQREFPRGIRVWQAACMNCHDNHSVQGARRLLREGTCSGFEGDSDPEPGACSDPDDQIKNGGNPAVEETCYQCHTPNAKTVLERKPVVAGSYGDVVPDIETEFLDGFRMPNTSDDQCRINGVTDTDCIAAGEVHSIGTGDWLDSDEPGANMLESQEHMGFGNPDNRHTECSDCHNPHRVTRNSWITGDGVPQRTHLHVPGVVHTNVASGAQRGNWGIEPVFTGVWGSLQSPSDSWIKKGLPTDGDIANLDGSTSDGTATGTPTLDAGELEALRAKPYLTREYQLCLRCHSNYAYEDDDGPTAWQGNGVNGASRRPDLGAQGGGTPKSAYPSDTTDANLKSDLSNGLTQYTNQLTEFNVRADDLLNGVDQQIRNDTIDTGAWDNYENTSNVNQRSWHPVHFPTGRDSIDRFGTNTNYNWREPWAQGVGSMTMYCSDCHGSAYGESTCVRWWDNDPEEGCREYTTAPSRGVWGPHGSANPFLLRGRWSILAGSTQSERSGNWDTDALCFNCHQADDYASAAEASSRSSAFSDTEDNLHTWHRDEAGGSNWRCTMCHIAIPHGWKNKSFLANLRDVGAEAGESSRVDYSSWPGDNYGGGGRTQRTLYRPPYYLHSLLSIRRFSTPGSWGESNSCGNPGSGTDWMQPACGM